MSSLSPSCCVFLGASALSRDLYLHHHTMFNPVSIIFAFNTFQTVWVEVSQPPNSFQFQQFSVFIFCFLPSFLTFFHTHIHLIFCPTLPRGLLFSTLSHYHISDNSWKLFVKADNIYLVDRVSLGYRDGAGNTVEENFSIFSLIWMH